MSKVKFIASLLLAAFGAFLAFYPLSPSIPNQSELEFTSGILLSTEFRSKIGSKFQLVGTNSSFVYQSHGRLCGNVHDRLLAEVGKSISIRYVPTQTKSWFGNSHPHQVLDISGKDGSICSYEQISAMIDSDFQAVPFLGYLMLIAGLIAALKVLDPVKFTNSSDTKTWKDLRDDLEAEEGARIIGEQWKSLPNNNEKQHQ